MAQPPAKSAARAEGPLTPDEVESLRRAYASGARGNLLIGLRQSRRLLTLMLPPRTNMDAASALLRRNAEQLRRLGADGFIHVRRARLLEASRHTAPAMLVHHRVGRDERCCAYRLAPVEVSAGLMIGLDDILAAVLRETIPTQRTAEQGQS